MCCPHDMSQMTEDQQIAVVKKNPRLIGKIDSPSDRVVRAALETDPGSIILVKDPTEEQQTLAISRGGLDMVWGIANPLGKVAELKQLASQFVT